jgi:replicative DNA helicase
LLQIISNIVLEGGYAYLIDQENGLDRVLKRLMCASASVNPDDLDRKFVPTEPWKRAETLVLEGAYSKRLFIERERFFDLNLVENRVRELMTLAEGRPSIVIIDSLQKLPMNLSDRRASIDGWMRGLENIRSKYKSVIFIASELKRPVQGQTYKPSEISLKESGDIEYSADLVLTLDRNENKTDDYVTEKAPDPATLRILYNRDGQTGRVANYRLVYPFHRVEEEARPDFEGIRRAGWVPQDNVTPIRPGLETSFLPKD